MEPVELLKQSTITTRNNQKMSITTGTSCVSRKYGLNPPWAITHRVVYDIDDDEDQQCIKCESSPPPRCDLSSLVESTDPPARSSPRLKKRPSEASSQIRAKSSTLSTSKVQYTNDQPKNSEAPAPTVEASPSTNTCYHASNEPLKDWRDDWIFSGPDLLSRWHQGYYGKWFEVEGTWQFTRDRVQPRGSIHYKTPKVRKPRTTFMSLPPEIRNNIYEYAIPERSVLISRTHPKKEARSLQNYWSEEHVAQNPLRSRLTHKPEWNYTSGDFANAINLLLTCKEIKHEVETFFYSRLLFCFYSLKSLRHFLHIAPKTGIQSIRRAFIKQDGYGNPQMTENQKYRDRYYQSWENVCTLFGQMVPHVKHLKLKVFDREWPCVLSGREYAPAWKASILKTAPALLPKVEVRIHHKMIDRNPEVLKDLARRVEDSMMTQAGREHRDRLETERVLADVAARRAAKEEKERKRKAKLSAAPPPTELVISMHDIQKQANKVSAANKVRSKGLEKFGRVDRSIYNFDVERYD